MEQISPRTWDTNELDFHQLHIHCLWHVRLSIMSAKWFGTTTAIPAGPLEPAIVG